MNKVVLIIIAIAAVFVVDIVFNNVLSPAAKSIVTWLTILFFALIYFCGQHAASSGAARLHKLGEQLDTEEQSQAVETEKQPNHKKQTRKEQEEKLHKLITSDKVKIVVDDESVSD